MKKATRIRYSAAVAATVLLVFSSCATGSRGRLGDISQSAPGSDSYWEFASPAAQGMDGGLLSGLLSEIDRAGHDIRSVTVVKNGKIVMDWYGWNRKTRQAVKTDDLVHFWSVTKSIVSVLLCAAEAEGKIEGPTETVMRWFTADGILNDNPEKRRMTLADLLTLRSGLKPIEERENAALFTDASNSAKAIFDRPMVAEPGTRWIYNNGDPQIASEILRRATGKKPAEYADEKLFGPLGISDYRWEADKSGTNFGGVGISMKPRDMARFGLFCLREGQWEGKQIIPAELMRALTSKHADTGMPVGNYGYYWWLPPIGGYVARGYLGQQIFVFPDQDLVVVITANLDYPNTGIVLNDLMAKYVLPAVKPR